MPPLVNSGTKTEREVLALLIERGIKYAEICGSHIVENRTLNPKLSDPINLSPAYCYHCFGPCYTVNAIGLAVLGLHQASELTPDLMEAYLHVVKAYKENVHRAQITKVAPEKFGYAAAADMLGLPLELLWEAEWQTFLGMLIPGIIDGLRH